jgi:hypothetical protein
MPPAVPEWLSERPLGEQVKETAQENAQEARQQASSSA